MESTQVKKKKLNPETIVVVVILAIIIVLFALFMRDIMIPLFKMQMNNDLRKYLDEKGYKYEYYENDGGHIWRNWRIYLTMFAQKIFK